MLILVLVVGAGYYGCKFIKKGVTALPAGGVSPLGRKSGAPSQYLREKCSYKIDVQIEQGNLMYLVGNFHNKGDKNLSDVVVTFTTKEQGAWLPPQVSLGPFRSNERRAIRIGMGSAGSIGWRPLDKSKYGAVFHYNCSLNPVF